MYFESLIGYRKGTNANGYKTLSDVWGPKSKAVYNYNAIKPVIKKRSA